MERNGGYTRIIRLDHTRVGDNARLVLLELVDTEKTKKPLIRGRCAGAAPRAVDGAARRRPKPGGGGQGEPRKRRRRSPRRKSAREGGAKKEASGREAVKKPASRTPLQGQVQVRTRRRNESGGPGELVGCRAGYGPATRAAIVIAATLSCKFALGAPSIGRGSRFFPGDRFHLHACAVPRRGLLQNTEILPTTRSARCGWCATR